MSSTPDQIFSTLNETKDYLNIARSNDDSNNTINTSRNAADNYVANQIRLHAAIPVTGTDDDSLINIQVSEGSEALKLIRIIEDKEYIQKEE